MLDETIHSFLAQTYQDIWTDYQYTLSSRYVTKWDYVVITASNEKQARAFEQQIEARLAARLIPPETRYLCIPDPEGKRVGSGGATLNVLTKIVEQEGDHFKGWDHLRILVIHSGGDSKRVPQYSACGKLFSPVPRVLPDGHRCTLFDEFMILLGVVPDRFSGGMFVLSGDVLLLFNPLQVTLSGNGATAISTKAPVSIGVEHGVFLSNAENEVTAFLHKQSAETLQRVGAVNKMGNVDLDTGMVWLGSGIIQSLWNLITVDGKVNKDRIAMFINDVARLSFYGDFLFPLASGSTLEQYLKEAPEYKFSDNLEACRKELWEALHKFTIDVKKLSPAKFIHFGTTSELRELMTDDLESYKFLGWKPDVLSNIANDCQFTGINSFICESASIGQGTFLEDANVATPCKIGNRCVVSNINLEVVAITIPDDTVVHMLPILDEKFCCRTFHVDDNPKNNLWFRKDLSELLAFYKIPDDKIYSGGDKTLWDAHLYPICDTVKDAIDWMQFLIKFMNREATKEEIDKWLATQRNSLNFDNADTGRVIDWQKALEDQIRVQRFVSEIEDDVPLAKAKRLLGCHKALLRELHRIHKVAETTKNISLSMRLYKAISVMLPEGTKVDDHNAGEFEDICFEVMKKETYRIRKDIQLSEGVPCEPAKETVCEYPVRVNWGGGWSDTPPYCYDFGGTVLNAAISLKGQLPVKAIAKVTEKKTIVLESLDIQCKQEFTKIDDLVECDNPFDPYSLHKASLLVSGIIKAGVPLEEQLDKLGGGLYMCTSANVPKGSGLGTSSILAGACIEALSHIRGRKYTTSEICDQTLCVEQLMSTGGGWQDQVGGIVNGIKLITSAPGIVQTLKVETLKLSEATLKELNERFVLIYTGQQRLARNILREIVGKVLVRDERTMFIVNEIQRLAVLMKFELERGNIDAFAKLLDVHWDLSKELDPGTTNTCIDYIFSCCEDMIDGRFICGAGGGGFLQVILKKGYTKAQIEERLEHMFQESGVVIYPAAFV